MFFEKSEQLWYVLWTERNRNTIAYHSPHYSQTGRYDDDIPIDGLRQNVIKMLCGMITLHIEHQYVPVIRALVRISLTWNCSAIVHRPF